MRVLITGGAGFIGSHLSQRLLSEGHKVDIYDNLSTGKMENVPEGANFIQADILHYEEIRQAVRRVNVVVHLAAQSKVQPSLSNTVFSHENNTTGMLNVLNASKEAGIRKFVFASSAAIYGDNMDVPHLEKYEAKPLSPYALQKRIGEMYCALYSRLFSVNTVCLRLFNVYGAHMPDEGPYSTVIDHFIRQKLANKPLTIVGDGNQTRDFIFVTDVVEAFTKAMVCDVNKGEIINIGTGVAMSINQLAQHMKHFKVNISSRQAEVRESFASVTKAKQLLNWEAQVGIDEGIKRTVEWYESQEKI